MAPSAAAVQTVQVALASATAILDDELARLRARTAENFAAPRVLSPAKRRLIARAATSVTTDPPPRPLAPYAQTLSKSDEAYAEPTICYEQYTAARSSRIVQDMPIAHLPCVGGEGALRCCVRPLRVTTLLVARLSGTFRSLPRVRTLAANCARRCALPALSRSNSELTNQVTPIRSSTRSTSSARSSRRIAPSSSKKTSPCLASSTASSDRGGSFTRAISRCATWFGASASARSASRPTSSTSTSRGGWTANSTRSSSSGWRTGRVCPRRGSRRCRWRSSTSCASPRAGACVLTTTSLTAQDRRRLPRNALADRTPA